MAVIKPFRGWRPKPDLVSQVASPPYDVISSEEARTMAQGNDLSFLHVVKSEIDLDPGINLYDDRVYEKAAQNFKRLIDQKIFFQEDRDCFYLYRLMTDQHEQVGIVACVSADDYQNNIIKRHELTRADKEKDRIKHIEALNAHTGPVFLSYRACKEIDVLVRKNMKENPAYDFFSHDKVQHTLWIMDEEQTISSLREAFREVSTIYIADGHHRAASSVHVCQMRREKNPRHTGQEEYNFFLGVLFPHNQVQILSYNRVVKDLNNLNKSEFLDCLKEKFEVDRSPHGEAYSPEEPHAFGMFLEGSWYRMKAKKKIIKEEDPVESLDVQILQTHVLSPVLGIKDPRTDKRIDFIGGIRGLKELERKVLEKKYKVAFALYPTRMKDLMKIADLGRVMPPKSTWFEPKLMSGLIVHELS